MILSDLSQLKKEYKELLAKLVNKKLYEYILNNLSISLSSIGFTEEFVNYFVNNLSEFNFEYFYNKFGKELHTVYDVGFFQVIVPDYFKKEVVPYIPKSNTLLDIGCGTGILLYTLSKESKFKSLIGIDIHQYPEWQQFNNPKIKFQTLKETDFENFLYKKCPDNIVLTWTLHHMGFDEQRRYLSNIFRIINKGSKIIILEDSYSVKLPPKSGKPIYNSFMELSSSERKKVMSLYDWIANRILARRSAVPIPFGYKTLEEWQALCEDIGYKIVHKIFIGFPDKRDINTPQSLLIIEK